MAGIMRETCCDGGAHRQEHGKGLAVSPVEYRILAEGIEIQAEPKS